MESRCVLISLSVCFAIVVAGCGRNTSRIVTKLKSPDNQLEIRVAVHYRNALDSGDYEVTLATTNSEQAVLLFRFQGQFQQPEKKSLQIVWTAPRTIQVRCGTAFVYDFANQAAIPERTGEFVTVILR